MGEDRPTIAGCQEQTHRYHRADGQRPQERATGPSHVPAPSSLPCGRLQQVPRPLDVASLGADVADGDAQREDAVDLGVGQEDVTRVVDSVHDALVEGVKLLGDHWLAFPAAVASWSHAETDGAEGDGMQYLSVRVGLDPVGQLVCEVDMLLQARAQSRETEIAQLHPHLDATRLAA